MPRYTDGFIREELDRIMRERIFRGFNVPPEMLRPRQQADLVPEVLVEVAPRTNIFTGGSFGAHAPGCQIIKARFKPGTSWGDRV